MSPLTPPVPVVLIGIHTEIGRAVAEGLRPEWDVIHFIQSLPAARADLPRLLEGSYTPPSALPPPPSHSQSTPSPPPSSSPTTSPVGSGNYACPARAVLFGRGFAQKDAEILRELFDEKHAKEPVLWVAGDAEFVARIRKERVGLNSGAGRKEVGEGEREREGEGKGGEEEEVVGVAGTPPPNAAEIIIPFFRHALEEWKERGAQKGELVLY